MKEIKAFIHRNRAADVIRALKGAGFSNLSVVDVKGMLAALDERERQYSIALALAHFLDGPDALSRPRDGDDADGPDGAR